MIHLSRGRSILKRLGVTETIALSVAIALVLVASLGEVGTAQTAQTAQTADAPPVQTKEKGALSEEKVAQAWKDAGWALPAGWKPVTNPKTVDAWGKAVEAAVLAGDIAALGKLIDFNQCYLRAVSSSTNEAINRDFVAGGKAGSENFFKAFSDSEGSYLFRRIESTEFGPCALMRLVTPDGAFNFQSWRLLENKEGDFVGVDFHSYIGGEALSETVERLFVFSLPDDDRNFIQKLFAQKDWRQVDGQQLVELLKAVRKGENKKVITIYNGMSPKMKDEKFVLLATSSAVMSLDEAMYVRLLERFRQKYPGEVAADIASIDVHFLKNDFDAMYKTIDRIESLVGQDAHLKLVRASGYITKDEPEKAIKVLQQALELEANYESPYWTLLELAVAQKKYGLVTETLKALVKNFGYNQFSFEGEQLYAQYIGTPEFKEFEAFLEKFNRGEN